jgi:hypothetical protein
MALGFHADPVGEGAGGRHGPTASAPGLISDVVDDRGTLGKLLARIKLLGQIFRFYENGRLFEWFRFMWGL